MSLVIANHVGPEVSAFLRAHPARPEVLAIDEPEAPWSVDPRAEVLVTRPLGAWRRASAADRLPPSVKWVQVMSAGVDAYPASLGAGRILTTGRGLSSQAIADYVLSAIMHFDHDMHRIRVHSPSDWASVTISPLPRRTVGLIGYGSIGRAIAGRVGSLGMRILASRSGPWVSDDPAVEACASPQEVAARADHLILVAPLTDTTRNMVNASLLSACKPGLHLVNVARGGLIDEAALLAALDEGRVARATLDVTEPEPLPEGHPFWTHGGIHLTPHLSWKGREVMAPFLAKLGHNLDRYLAGQPLEDVFDPDRGY